MKYIATINGKRYEVEVERVEGYKSLDRNGVAAPKAPALAKHGTGTETGSSGTCSSTSPGCSTGTCSSTAPAAAPAAGATTVEAPMPGKVLDVKVTAGQAVKYGDVVAIMEAMKMEQKLLHRQTAQ